MREEYKRSSVDMIYICFSRVTKKAWERGRKGCNRFAVSPFRGSGVQKMDALKRPLRAGLLARMFHKAKTIINITRSASGYIAVQFDMV